MLAQFVGNQQSYKLFSTNEIRSPCIQIVYVKEPFALSRQNKCSFNCGNRVRFLFCSSLYSSFCSFFSLVFKAANRLLHFLVKIFFSNHSIRLNLVAALVFFSLIQSFKSNHGLSESLSPTIFICLSLSISVYLRPV